MSSYTLLLGAIRLIIVATTWGEYMSSTAGNAFMYIIMNHYFLICGHIPCIGLYSYITYHSTRRLRLHYQRFHMRFLGLILGDFVKVKWHGRGYLDCICCDLDNQNKKKKFSARFLLKHLAHCPRHLSSVFIPYPSRSPKHTIYPTPTPIRTLSTCPFVRLPTAPITFDYIHISSTIITNDGKSR